MASEYDKAVDRLYSARLEDFVSLRSKLAGKIKDDHPNQAGRLKKLRKPSVGAWALNQLARNQRKQVEWLFEADERLRRATDREEINKETAARREIIGRLTEAALSAVRDAGYATPGGLEQKVAAALTSVAVDEDAKQLLRDGLFTKEPAASGFGEAAPAADPKAEASRRASRLEVEAVELSAEAERLREEKKLIAGEVRRLQKQVDRLSVAAEKAEEKARKKRAEAEDLS